MSRLSSFTRSVFSALRVLGATSLIASATLAQNCSTTRVSVDANGNEGDGSCGITALNGDGHFVVFTSGSTNLVAGDTNGVDDVFVVDRVTGAIERVSVATNGAECDRSATYPSMSADGRFVVFSTWATTLDPNDTNGVSDVYVRDRLLGTTECISVTPSGAAGNNGSFLSSISADGRFVVFTSFASDLVPNDTNDVRDVFVRDRVLGTTERVSVSTSGAQGNDSSGGSGAYPSITSDGRFVGFASNATNLVAGDTNGFSDVFVRDRALVTTVRVSLGLGGVQADDDCEGGALSDDARYVGISSAATNLVANDTNAAGDAFVVDRATGVITRVSVSSLGAEGAQGAWSVSLSSNGRFAAFLSPSSEFVVGDTNNKRDVFVHDLFAGTTERLSVGDSFAQTDADCSGLSISGDGAVVAFTSVADLLVAGDTNGFADAFVRECRTATNYCFGTASACPCGNGGAYNSGCANSVTSGAALDAEGRCSVAADSLTLVVTNVPPSTTVMFLQALSVLNGGHGVAFGDGLRCVGGVPVRLGQRHASHGVARFGFGIGNDPLLSVIGAVPAGGDWRYYQVWYRNPALFCTNATFNFSNGTSIQWGP